jgi:hypothetical protein
MSNTETSQIQVRASIKGFNGSLHGLDRPNDRLEYADHVEVSFEGLTKTATDVAGAVAIAAELVLEGGKISSDTHFLIKRAVSDEVERVREMSAAPVMSR